jgi:hypothetical protein
MMNDYGRFYSQHLKQLKWRASGEGIAKCPFHNDRRASFSVNRVSGLWFCHACNSGGPARGFAERLGIDAPAGNGKSAEYVFDYRDEAGALLYQVVRFAGKKFRQRRPDGKGGWVWNLDGVRRVPYRLPELLKSSSNVFIVEGEKDVETLRAQGWEATCNAGGAGKWREEYGEALTGRVCILIADNDDPGRDHVADVERKLAPYAKIVNLGALPGSREHGDVSDWLAAGRTAADLLALITQSETADSKPTPRADAESQWPAPMADAAFHGPAGEFVKLVGPNTEADPAALLVQLLIAFGNLCGPTPYRLAAGVRHRLNEYAVIVGDTSRARKGTSWAEVERFIEKIDSGWTKHCVTSGLSTGEGLIWHVRDPQAAESENYPDRNGYGAKGRAPDAGASDKRLLVQAGEFAAVLKVGAGEGSTLSPVLREAWDSKALRTLAKNSPATASGAHISIIGHITHEELVRALDATESANGFANRFVWVCAKRSNMLPWGGTVQNIRLDDLAVVVSRAAEAARKAGEFEFDQGGARLWEQIYPKLTEGKPGLLGAIVGRSEAHVLRFSCIYAALDASRTIAPAHLGAALALWGYCERSAKYIFGNRLGDPDADTILEALRARPDGMTRTEIHELFGRNAPAARISRARDVLIKARLMRIESNHAQGGRPAERWRAEGVQGGEQ